MLNGMRVVVTGSAGTLGKAVVEVAAGYGAEVIEFDRGDSEQSAQGPNYHQVDLLNKASTQAVFEKVAPFDAVINVAGGFAMGEQAHEISGDQWDSMFKINVVTLRSSLSASVPSLIKQGRGRIVNVGALGAVSGAASMSAYVCAKSAVMRITESLAEEVGSSGVTVNAVLPSIIDTPANRAAMPDEDHSCWVAPGALAEVMCFLASERAVAVNGALVPVRGRLK